MLVIYYVLVLPVAMFLFLLDLPVLAIGLVLLPLFGLLADIGFAIYDEWKERKSLEEAA